LIAGGKSKKTKRTEPKSDDVYLKLLVKVEDLTKNPSEIKFFFFLGEPISGEENRKQVQCRDFEAFVHEQSEQSATVSLSSGPIHGRKGLNFVVV